MRTLTYDDFLRTGVQDCGNVMSIDEFDLRAGGTAEEIVERTWAEWEADGMEEQWLEQQDDLEGLDPHQCYDSWKVGWKSCAVATLEEHVERAKERRLDDEEYERETRGNPPKKWWHRPSPSPRPCYRTKADALKAFLDVNSDIIENYGGADYAQSPSEFDSINHKYGLKGKRAARSIADAVWYAMPVGKPFCLDRIDLDALNDTSPARESESAFRLPDINYEARARAQEAAHYTGQEPEEAEELPSWVTERESAEPVRVFPALPSMDGLVPFGARLERREPWAETYQLYDERPIGPLPPRDVTPVKLTLEEREPGVETYSINPAGKVRIKMTSTRSGKVGWIRPDGTPSDYESEAGFFTPDEAQATIAEYTENLVRVVGRCANRFEMLPNPPPGEHPRRRKFQKPRTGVHVDASTPTMFRELVRIATPYTAKREEDGSFTILNEERWRAIMSSCEAREVESPKQNPAWVTKIIARHFEALEGIVPLKWLPKLTKARAKGGQFVASMKEYGCGAYGCVLPTHDEKVVLKLTTDDTEAEFASDLAGKLAAPVVVRYHRAEALPDKYKGRPSFLLWRDAADYVGDVSVVVSERGGDGRAVEKAIQAQHKAAQKAFSALDAKGWDNKKAKELVEKWEIAARAMGDSASELKPLAQGMIRVLRENKVFMGDVHSGNIGRVGNRWVVVDPGHIAVLRSEDE